MNQTEHLKLGDLIGNHFRLVIRNLEIADNENEEKRQKLDLDTIVSTARENITKNGFLNYFGLQRFGSSSVSTHQVGIEILKENFEGAVDLLLCPRDEAKHRSFMEPMRNEWKNSRDAAAALEKLPRKFSTEGKGTNSKFSLAFVEDSVWCPKS